MEDASLVARFRTGENEAFALLYERYRDAAYRYALALVGDAALAEDAVQTAFLRAFRAMGETDRDIAFRPWLLRITRNICWDELRRRRVILLPPEELPEEGPRLGPVHQHEEAERRALARRVHQVLRSLPPRYREALVLRELMGLGYEDLAEVMGCTLASVKVLLHRARLQFARKYESSVLARSRRGCRDLAELVSAHLDGALDQGAARRVERHVADCPLCREEIARLRRVGELFSFLPVPLLPASLLEAGRWAPWAAPAGAPPPVSPAGEAAAAQGEAAHTGTATASGGSTGTSGAGSMATTGAAGAGAATSGFSLANLATVVGLLGALAGGGYLFGTQAGHQALADWRRAAGDLARGLATIAGSPGRQQAEPLVASLGGGSGVVAGLEPGQTLTRELNLRNPNGRAVSYRLTVEGTGDLFACRPGPAPHCDGGPAALSLVRLRPDGGEEAATGWLNLPAGAEERLLIRVHLPATAGPAYAGASGTLRVRLDQR